MRVFRTVKRRINGLLIMFLALALCSFFATYITVQMHRNDEPLVEQVHNELSLIHQLTRLMLDGGSDAQIEDALLALERTHTFVRESVVRAGTSARFLDAHAMNLHVEALDAAWALYRTSLGTLSELAEADPLREQVERNLQMDTRNLAVHVEELGQAIESHDHGRHRLLLRIQIVFVTVMGFFTFLAYLLVRQRVVEPLDLLTRAAQQVRHGVLHDEPLGISGSDEIGQLAASFEQMRAAVLTNQTQLEQRIDARTRELATALEFSQEIVQQLDVQQLVHSITSSARALMRVKDATLCLVTPDGCSVELAKTTAGSVNGKLTQPIQEGLLDVVVANRRTVRSQVSKFGCAFLQHSPEDQCLSAPLQVGDQVIGAMCVVRSKEQPFRDEESRAFHLLANSAAVAISNARYTEEARQRAKDAAVTSERERLAAELHDHLAQTLSLVALKISEIQEASTVSANGAAQEAMEQVRMNVNRAFEQVRMISGELAAGAQPKEDEFGMRLSLDVRSFEETAVIPVEVTGVGSFLEDVAPLTQRQMLLIIGEALANVRRHAEARRVAIRFRAEEDIVQVEVEDDGKGFYPHSMQGTDHLGLRIMRARAERTGGALEIDSSAGRGTRVIGRFPKNGAGSN